MMDYVLPSDADLTQIPAGLPPPGVIPNFVDPPSRAWVLGLSVYTTLPVMVLFFGFRVYVRLFLLHNFGIDDYLCLIAATTSAALCGVLLWQFADNTWGRHIWDIPLSIFLGDTISLKANVIVGALYNLAAVSIKLTFFTLYLRLFDTVSRLRIWIWAGIVGITVFHIVVTILTFYFCIPHEGDGGWGSVAYNLRCGTNYLKLNTSQGVISTLTDFYVLAVPITTVLSLQMSQRRRIGVAGIFITGFLATIFSLVGVIYRFNDLFASPPDYTWLSLYIEPLAVAEVNVGVICTCMPIVFGSIGKLSKKIESAWSSSKTRLGLSNHSGSIPSRHEAGKTPSVSIDAQKAKRKGSDSDRYIELRSMNDSVIID